MESDAWTYFRLLSTRFNGHIDFCTKAHILTNHLSRSEQNSQYTSHNVHILELLRYLSASRKFCGLYTWHFWLGKESICFITLLKSVGSRWYVLSSVFKITTICGSLKPTLLSHALVKSFNLSVWGFQLLINTRTCSKKTLRCNCPSFN